VWLVGYRIVNEPMGRHGPPEYVTPVHAIGFGGVEKIGGNSQLLLVGVVGHRTTYCRVGTGIRRMSNQEGEESESPES
jgi:hypothetical protein